MVVQASTVSCVFYFKGVCLAEPLHVFCWYLDSLFNSEHRIPLFATPVFQIKAAM